MSIATAADSVSSEWVHEIKFKVSYVKEQQRGHSRLNSKLSVSEKYNCIAVDKQILF